MKYKVKNTDCFELQSSEELLTRLLNQRGVEDIEAFLNPQPEHLHSPFLFKNMEAGCHLLAKHLKNKSRSKVLVD